jgi:hypothetical protein
MDSLDYKIFVPTKNRVDNCSTIINSNDIILNVVVEPQDYDKYYNKYPGHKYLIIPENNRGITYVRNYIKKYTEDNSILNYWQLDDDISSIYHRENTSLKNTGYINLLKAEQQFINNNIALGGLEYRQFAWSANKNIIINSFCDSCVFVDNVQTFGMRYNDYLEGKEDRDFAMQVIKAGKKTGRTTLYAFSAPKNGSNSGGLKETFYDIGKENICSDRMVEVWGNNICNKYIKNDGRPDVKINWKNINQTTLF